MDSLVSAQDINDAGHITGKLLERSTCRLLPLVAIPKTRVVGRSPKGCSGVSGGDETFD